MTRSFVLLALATLLVGAGPAAAQRYEHTFHGIGYGVGGDPHDHTPGTFPGDGASASVPEPLTFGLIGAGLAGALILRRRGR